MSKLDEKKTELRDLQYEYRKSCRDILVEYVGGARKMSPHTAAIFLERTPKTIYAWLSEKLFLPKLPDCELIDKLGHAYNRIFESWKTEIVAFSNRGHVHGAVKKVLYDQSYLKILEDKKLTFDQKAERLTLKTMRAWAQALEAKK